MAGIHVVAAELHGRFTGHPERPLRDMMVGAAQRALESAGMRPDKVDALFAGAMGNFEPEGFVGPIPIQLANALGLSNADITPMLVGSSEAGAWALRLAYDSMKGGAGYRRVLVVAGEQMNPLASDTATDPAASLAQRRARSRDISDILDVRERHYGLNMVRMGDLILDMLRHTDGWTERDLADGLLPLVAMTKYERVVAYPMGHLHGKVTPDLDEYRRRAPLAHYLNLHDVTPTSSGAVALVLSRRPGPNGMEILGMGQAVVPVSLAARPGEPRQARAVRTAIGRACRDAQVDVDWLLESDFALVHDAFPSIEYFFLKELGLDPEAIVDRVTSGWSNPFGGLKTCGHALGASGLLQVAKAYHRMTLDPRYITAEARQRMAEVDRCFATSVGGAFTNVVVSILRRADRSAPNRPSVKSTMAQFDGVTQRIDAAWESLRRRIPSKLGLVLASTRIRHNSAFGDDEIPLFAQFHDPWIHLIDTGSTDSAVPKALAFSPEPVPAGRLVHMRRLDLDGATYRLVEPVVESLDLPALGRTPVSWSLRVAVDRRLSGYSTAPIQLLEPAVDVVPGRRCYALDAEGNGWRMARCAVVDSNHPASLCRARIWLGAPDAEVRARLDRWGALDAESHHPNLERYLSHATAHLSLAGLEGPGLVLLTELLAGLSLADFLGGRPLEQRLLSWCRQLARAVLTLHTAGLAHGRLSASDVVVIRGDRPVLTVGGTPRAGALATPLAPLSEGADQAGLADIILTLVRGRPTVETSEARRRAVEELESERPSLAHLLRRLLAIEDALPYPGMADAVSALHTL